MRSRTLSPYHRAVSLSAACDSLPAPSPPAPPSCPPFADQRLPFTRNPFLSSAPFHRSATIPSPRTISYTDQPTRSLFQPSPSSPVYEYPARVYRALSFPTHLGEARRVMHRCTHCTQLRQRNLDPSLALCAPSVLLAAPSLSYAARGPRRRPIAPRYSVFDEWGPLHVWRILVYLYVCRERVMVNYAFWNVAVLLGDSTLCACEVFSWNILDFDGD